jgi:hypothetical protein
MRIVDPRDFDQDRRVQLTNEISPKPGGKQKNMALQRTGLLIAVCLFLSLPMHAQQAATFQRPVPPVKDADAVALVQTAIQALGGESALKQLQAVAFQGSMVGASQPSSVYAATWQAPPAKPKSPVNTAAPIKVPLGPASVVATLVRQFHSGLSLKYVGPVASGASTLTAVTFHANLPAGVTVPIPDQTWYFNQAGLPARIEYQVTSQPGVIQLQAIDLSDYRPVSGLLFPFQMVLHRDDQQNQTITIQTATPTTK